MPDSCKPWLQCGHVETRLTEVEALLLSVIQVESPLITEVCLHLIRAGGKRLRPALVLLAAQFGAQKNDPQIVHTAVAVELLHLATLYHDDVIDESKYRRHVPSVNAIWGNRLAVSAGNLLFARAVELFASAGDDVNRVMNGAIQRLWDGQMRETEAVHNLDLDEKRYFEIIQNKTAVLYELACHLGALLSGAPPPLIGRLRQYGHDLGIAFQLVDDVMDIANDRTILGKDPGRDLQEGIYTLPVIYSLAHQNPQSSRLRAILSQVSLSAEDLDETLMILRTNGSVLQTLNAARQYLNQAREQLTPYPPDPAKASLAELAAFVIERASHRS